MSVGISPSTESAISTDGPRSTLLGLWFYVIFIELCFGLMRYSKDHGMEEEVVIKRYEVSGGGFINLATVIGDKVKNIRSPNIQLYFASPINGRF